MSEEEEQEPNDPVVSTLAPLELHAEPSWTDPSPPQHQPPNWTDSTSLYDELHSTYDQGPEISDCCTRDNNPYPLIDAWNDEAYYSQIFSKIDDPTFLTMPSLDFQLPQTTAIPTTTIPHQTEPRSPELTHRTSFSSTNPWAESATSSIIDEPIRPNPQPSPILREASSSTSRDLRPRLFNRDSGYETASARSSMTTFFSEMMDSSRSETISPSQTPRPGNDPYSHLHLLAARGGESSQLRTFNFNSSPMSCKSGLDFCKGKRLNPFRRAHNP
jgi:hypothetical protein